MEIHHPADAERYVAELAAELITPDADECVLCSTATLLRRFGCDGTLRWVRRWRDVLRPRATALERRMHARGGFCDCEVFRNGWELRADLLVPDGSGEPEPPPQRQPCARVGPRSSQPCANWVPQRRPRW